MTDAPAPYYHKLDHPGGRTEIVIGAGVLDGEPEGLADWLAGRTAFVLTTPRLVELHGMALAAATRGAARVVRLSAPDGEDAKSLDHAGRLWQEMLSAGGKRDSRMVTFGGGTIGDLGGAGSSGSPKVRSMRSSRLEASP